jgi:2-methylisocitrate lyase-like PEP mutase family enzyme
VFLNGSGSVDEAVERANAYLAAGADCAYPIFCPPETVAKLAQRIDGPINVLLTPKMPSVAELGALGAARLTWGAGLAGLAYREAARIVSEALSE